MWIMEDKNQMKLFIKKIKNKELILVISAIILTIISFLIRIIVSPISIDTESFLVDSKGIIQSWESVNRVSLCFLKRIFLSLNLVTINILAVIILIVSYFILAKYVLTKLKKANFTNYVLFILIILTSLATIESYAFTLQILEISICYFLMIVSFLLIDKIIYYKKYLYLIVVVPFIAFTLNAYQSFYLMEITLSCLLYILNYKEDKRVVTIFKYIIILIMAIVVSNFLLKGYLNFYHINPNSVDNGYLLEQINYRTSIKKGIFYLGATVIYTCFGKNVVNISYLITVIIGIWYLRHKQEFLYRLSFLFLLISPFLMSIFLGNYTFMRSQFSAPIITAFVFLKFIDIKKIRKLVFFQLFYQIMLVMLLFSYDNVRY